VPGLGTRTVERLLQVRRHRTLRLDDIARLAGSVKRVRAFLVTADHRPTRELDRIDLRAALTPPPRQLSLFG
jgi:predicted DNA-binding helix-hairpin-helix protein